MNLSIPTITSLSNENDIVILNSPKTVLIGKVEAFNEQFVSLLVAGKVCQLPLDIVQSVVFARKQKTDDDLFPDALLDEIEKDMNLELEEQTDMEESTVFAWLGLLILFLMLLG